MKHKIIGFVVMSAAVVVGIAVYNKIQARKAASSTVS